MTQNVEPPRSDRTPHSVYAVTLLVAALIGFAAVYGMAKLGNRGNLEAEAAAGSPRLRIAQALPADARPAEPPPGQPLPAGPGSNPLSVGEMAAFVFKKAPEPLPDVTFVDGAGKERSLKDWRGKVVVLNLWATWCIPCRKEMPGLDRLQAELGSDQFEVVAVSADKTGIEGARKFLAQVKAERLAVYADPGIRITSTLKAVGMPATILIDREGREIGRLVGPAEWDSKEAKALIAAALSRK